MACALPEEKTETVGLLAADAARANIRSMGSFSGVLIVNYTITLFAE
jgi:hypothetical protein